MKIIKMNQSNKLKELAIHFLKLTATGQVQVAYELVAPNFIHHNPYFASDAETLKAGMLENAIQFPHMIFEVQRVIAEDLQVVVHSKIKMQADALDMAAIHIVRFENDKIVELWDIVQQQPEKMLNELGMF